jgi:hypothetical protein
MLISLRQLAENYTAAGDDFAHIRMTAFHPQATLGCVGAELKDFQCIDVEAWRIAFKEKMRAYYRARQTKS